MKPTYKMIADGTDISETLVAESATITVVDNSGIDSDTLTIECTRDAIEVPSTGAELEPSLGYEGEPLTTMGLFIVDEIEISRTKMFITAKAANLSRLSKDKKNTIKSQKDFSWKNATIGSIVSSIAVKHNYIPIVSPELATILIKQRDQLQESDLNFLTRLAVDYNAIFKPTTGRLVFATPDTATSISGEPLLPVELKEENLSPGWKVRIKDRHKYGSVSAVHWDTQASKQIKVVAGAGEPALHMSRNFPTVLEAQRAATYALKKLNTGSQALSGCLEGNPDMQAEAPLTIDLGENIPQEWIFKSVTHSLGVAGYKTSFVAENKK